MDSFREALVELWVWRAFGMTVVCPTGRNITKVAVQCGARLLVLPQHQVDSVGVGLPLVRGSHV